MDSAKVVCFNCMGSVHQDMSFHQNGFLASGELHRIFDGNSKKTRTPVRLQIFNLEFADYVEFVNNIDTIFNIARQKFRRLERCIYKFDSDLHVEHSELYWNLRLDVCKFFRLLSICTESVILQNDRSLKQKLMSLILVHVKLFITCIGQLSDCPDHVILNMASSIGNKCQAITYHYLHLHLDIWWYLIKILYALTSTTDDSSLTQLLKEPYLADMYYIKSFICQTVKKSMALNKQFIQLLLWDLVNIALKKFNKVTQEEYYSITPFTCSCIKEIWVVLLHVLDHKQINEKELQDNFWVVLHNIFQAVLLPSDVLHHDEALIEMNSTHFNLVPDFSNVNRLGFCWWILLHVAPLYQLDSLGCMHFETRLMSNYFEAEHLTKLTLDLEDNTCSESQLRCFLNCCVRVCQLWEPSVEIVILLWEYFYKRINDIAMEELGETTNAHYGKSGLKWLEHIKSITKDSLIEPPSNLNSYEIFLRLMGVQLKKSRRLGSAREWKQLKGRVFAKFHPRKLLELNKVGLHNCFSLFLTLASLADLDDMVLEIVNLVELMDPALVELKKCGVLWKAMFALMLICEEQQHDLSGPAKKLANDFDSLARKISENSSYSVNHHMASELLNIYLEGLKDLFEHSASLNLSEYILIASNFSELLSHSSISDLEMALSVVQVILARQRGLLKKKFLAENGSGETGGGSIEKEHYDALADALWSYVFPLLKEQVIGKVPYDIVAGVATGFTILMLDRPVRPSCPMKESFKTLLEYFGLCVQTHAELCCQYLVNLLSQNSLLEKMESEMPDCQAQIIRTWFRLSLEMSGQSTSYQDLTRLVLKLPEILDLYRETEHMVPSFNSQADPSNEFLKALGLWQTKMVTPHDMFAARHKVEIYLADAVKVSNAVLAKSNIQHEISKVYHIMGNVVYHISPLIYIKGKSNCLLNAILKDLLLQQDIYNTNKVINDLVLIALKDNLQLFIDGIGKLNFRKDPYIKRTLKDIFIHYLPRYSLKSSEVPGTPMHPFVVILLNVRQHNNFGLDILLFAVEEIRNHYLAQTATALASETTKNIELGLDFMKEILLRCSLKEKSAVCSILLVSMLKMLLLLDFSSFRQQATDIIQMLVTSANPEDNRSPLGINLKEIIKQYLITYPERVFRLLVNLAKIYPSIIKNLLPVLEEQISIIEHMKGGGHDSVLRMKYSHFRMDVEILIKQ